MYFVGDVNMYKWKGKKEGNDYVSMKAHNTTRILPKHFVPKRLYFFIIAI